MIDTYCSGFHSDLSTQAYGLTPQCLQKPPGREAATLRSSTISDSPASARKSSGRQRTLHQRFFQQLVQLHLLVPKLRSMAASNLTRPQ